MPQPFDHHLPLESLPAGARVLDLGCGPGTTDYPAYRRLRFFGVDQYPDAASSNWPANAWLTLADAQRLPFADQVFDLGLAGFVFEHFAAPGAALRELSRVLKPGALLHLSIPRSTSLHDRLYRFTFKGGGHLQRYSLESFVEMVYAETAFKLEGYAPSQGGFTWLRDVPSGEYLYGLLFRSFRAWAELGWHPLEASDYRMLFRLGERGGYQRVDHVCAHCGTAFLDAPGQGTWQCQGCSFVNIKVPSSDTRHPTPETHV